MPGDLITTSQAVSAASPPSAVAGTGWPSGPGPDGRSSTSTGEAPSVASLRRLAVPSTPSPQTPARAPRRSDQQIASLPISPRPSPAPPPRPRGGGRRTPPDPAAGRARGVAEEAPAGGPGGHRDVAAGQASPAEQGAVGRPQAAQPPAGAVGPDDAVGAPAEALA